MCMGNAMLAVDRNKLWGKKDAKYWFERAALNGNKEAAWALYRMPGNLDYRQKWLQFAAESGDREAQYELYKRLIHDRCSDEDLNKALNWLKAAAENDHPKAQYDLAKLNRRGLQEGGISKNLTEARRWLERAAELGYKQAIWETADRYERGTEGFSLDLNQAKRFYLLSAKASREDRADVQPMIGSLAEAKSRIAAIQVLLHGLERGDPAALRMFALRHLEAYEPGPGVRENGVKWLERLGSQGDIEAQFDLGSIYVFGRYQIRKDQTRGKPWWRRAAKGRHVRAMERVANGHINGNYGFAVDYLKAKSLVGALIRTYREGLNGTGQDERQAQRWERELAFLDRRIDSIGGSYQSPETLRSKASANDAEAQYQLARQLFIQNQIKNGREILNLYRKAAANGHVGANMELFRLYQRGLSYTSTDNPGQVNVVIPKDDSKVLLYLKQAANSDHPKALGELALAYEKGRFGLSRDLGKARDLYQKIIHAFDNDLYGWTLEERLINMYRKRLEYTQRAITLTEERNRRYETATEVEKRIMDIEARYQREYTRQANSVCANQSRCSKEYIRNERQRIRRELFAECDQEILRYRSGEQGQVLH